MRIVHVMRHGVDVAASLNTRSNRNWDADSDRFEKWLPIYRWRRSQLPIRRGQRAATLENALDFWAEQVSIENSIIGQREEVLRIRFEDILSQPEMKISEIAEFAGSSISPDMLEEMTSSLDPSRHSPTGKIENYRNSQNRTQSYWQISVTEISFDFINPGRYIKTSLRTKID